MADVQKEIALKVTTDTTQTQSALKGAEDRLNDAKKRMIELAVAGKQNTEEFRKLAQEAGTLKGRLELVEQTVDGIGKSANKIEVFSGAVQGIAASFALAQGAASLFAEGDEELQQAFVKTQAALAILAGTEQAVQLLRKESAAGQALLTARTAAYSIVVGTTTGALKLFRIALAATGIGALIIGVGLLVANFDKLTEAVNKFINSSPVLTKVISFITDGFTSLGRAIGIIPSESEKATRQMIADLEKQQKLLEAAGANTYAIEKRLAELRVQLAKETGKDLEQAEQDLTLVIAKEEGKRFAISEEQRLKNKEARKKYEADRALAEAEITKQGMWTAQGFLTQSLEMQQKGLDAELLQLMEANGKGFEERQKVLLAQGELDKFYRDLRIKDAEAEEAAKFAVASQAAGALSALAASIAAEGGKNAEKAFKVSKALAIVQATIDTISGAQAAFAQTAGGIVIKGIAAAAATVAGIARVNQIRKQQFNAPSSPTNVPTAAPSLGGTNVGGNVPNGFDPQSTNLGGFSQPNQNGVGGSNGNSRVIVVERDIRNVANRVNSTERFATFG